MATIKVKNFLFHRVNPVRDELWDPMDVRKFDQCVRYLIKNFQVVSLEEACSVNFKPEKKPLATISFDDGYQDNLEYAAPILQKYHCPASFYIVTDCIDNGSMVWTQEIKHYFQNTSRLQLNSDLHYFPPELRINTWKDRRDLLADSRIIRDFLLAASLDVRQSFMEDLRNSFTDVSPINPMMNWSEVEELHAAGFIIGSHTRTHPVLPVLNNPEDLENELTISGNRIKQMLGTFPASIAYPFGAYDQAVSDAALRAGYTFGVTSNQQWYFSDKDDAYAISRTLLSNEPWIKILSRIHGSFQRIRELVKGQQPQPWKTLIKPTRGASSSAYGTATGVLDSLTSQS